MITPEEKQAIYSQFQGTKEQLEDRDERVAIMVYCGKETEQDAQKYCNGNQARYGYLPI